MMENLSINKNLFSLVFNQNRICQHWYHRYLNAGVDLDRIRRVVARIGNWYQ